MSLYHILVYDSNCAKWLALLCVFLSTVPFNLSLYHDNIPCSPVGSCKCDFPNGFGIDLSPLRGYNFTIQISPSKELLYFPCKNGLVPNIPNATTLNECENEASICLKTKLDNSTFTFNKYGSLFESSFLWDRISDDPALEFKHGEKNTVIFLHCDRDGNNATMTLGDTSASYSFSLALISEHACILSSEETGRSILTTIFMIFLVLFLLYFLGGFLVLRFIRGARGWEAIPHGEFWSNSFTSVKQIISYCVNGCRRPETYDTI